LKTEENVRAEKPKQLDAEIKVRVKCEAIPITGLGGL
jgi:hypothetical protein